jgi:hypothetical protein
MKLIIPFLLISFFFLGCEKATIKSSDDHSYNTYEANPRLSGGEVGFKLDQKTGDTVELMYKGKSYVPAHKDTVFVELVEPPSKLDEPVFDVDAHRRVTVEQGWEEERCFNLRQLSTVGWYKGCIVYNKKLGEPLDPSKEFSEYFGSRKKITPVMVYAEREKAANFMISYVRKMKGKECNE